MPRRNLFPLLLLLLSLAGCTTPRGDGDSKPGVIQAKDDVFSPAQFAASVGKDVEWKNVGKNFHTVTVQTPGAAPRTYVFDEEIQPGESVTFSFPEPGTYDLFCRYHSQGAAGDFSGGMVMKVTAT